MTEKELEKRIKFLLDEKKGTYVSESIKDEIEEAVQFLKKLKHALFHPY